MMDAQFQRVFDALKKILADRQAGLILDKESPGGFSLNTPYVARYQKPLFFGAVQIKKNYVSFYLMPVYIFPDLLTDISPELKRRMQGKSCFNFKKLEPPLFVELTELTRRSYDRFRVEGFLDAGGQE